MDLGYSNIKSVYFLFASICISGCGGSDNQVGVNNTNSSPPKIELNQGGQASSPTQVSYAVPNVISSDKANNYYKVNVKAGDTLVLNVDLDSPITAKENMLCNTSPEKFTHALIEKVLYFCAYDLKYTFSSDGDYILRFQYPLSRKGIFHASLLKAGVTYSAFPANGSGGTPNQPRVLGIGVENKINKLTHYNNYQYTGLAGDKLVFRSLLNAPLAANSRVACVSSSNYTYSKLHAFGLSVDYSNYSCTEHPEYTLPWDGTFNFNIRFIAVDTYGKIDGTFRVDLVR